MDNFKHNKFVYISIIILLVLVFGLGGYIIYDKLSTDKNNSVEEDNVELNMINYNDYNLASRYNNITDKGSYIIFNENGTWEASQNYCEGYSKINGTYSIINNEIILENNTFNEVFNVLTIVYSDSSDLDIILLSDKDGFISDCSLQKYYVMEE